MVIWPGGTTKLPQDVLRLDPKNISIGWVIESAWATPVSEQESRMYAQQAVDEINDDLFLLPNTFLTLEVETVMNNAKTVEAHNAVEARAKAAGRPLAAFLAVSSSHMATIYAPQALVTVTQQSTGVPIVGFYTGAGVLSDSKQFPNFIRLYPPVSDTQHVFRKMLLKFGWRRVGLLCDKTDAYSKSFFDVMNGTDPSNPSNLQPPLSEVGSGGPYDDERLTIVHAELVDFGKDANVTADALVAAIKAKDVKVFILFGQTSFVDVITLHGLDRGIFGPGYQVFVSDDGVITDQMSDRSRAALDGAVQIAAASIAPEYTGLKRASSFWKRHPPTHPPPGSDTTVPFMVSGRQARFHDASLYDSIMLAAVSIEACLKAGCRAVGHGYEEAMPYFRAAIVDGVAGTVSTKAGSNDPLGRIFSVQVGQNPASRGLGGPYTFNEVTTTSSRMSTLQMCKQPMLGEQCRLKSASPGAVRCFASSATSIDVEWEPVPNSDTDSQFGLLDGYRVTAFYLDEQIIATVNRTAATRVTFSRDVGNIGTRLKANIVYSVHVEALYDNATVRSKATACKVPMDGLPCIPPPTAASDSAEIVGTDSRRRLGSKEGAVNCRCLKSDQVWDALNASGHINEDGHIFFSGAAQPLYPADRNSFRRGAVYGSSCVNHDHFLPPSCADDTGKPLLSPPAWCVAKWCFVDPDSCSSQAPKLSSYFARSKLMFSYETCGHEDPYSGVCGCNPTTEFHTQGLPAAMEDPPLQRDGSVGGPAREWTCEVCLEGTQCFGGVAATVLVKPGYFVVRSLSKATGAEKRPKLWPCPGGPASCPGGTSITKVMGALASTTTTAARACENISTMSNDFDAARLQQDPQCQCAPGGTGLLCRTCKSSAIVGGKGWIMSGDGGICRQCALSSADATNILATATIVILLFVVCAVWLRWRYTRPSVMEERFIDAFRRINELGTTRCVNDFFGVAIGSGITQKVFVAAVVQQCGGGKHINGGGGVRDGAGDSLHALNLWRKLDEDEVHISLLLNKTCVRAPVSNFVSRSRTAPPLYQLTLSTLYSLFASLTSTVALNNRTGRLRCTSSSVLFSTSEPGKGEATCSQNAARRVPPF